MSLQYSIEHTPKSLVRISTTIPATKIESVYEKTLAELLKTAKMDGFREGHVPRDIYLQRVGTTHIWEESAMRVIPDLYIEIVTTEKLPVIGQPSIRITKIADHTDVEIIIESPILPTFALGDYKKSAKETFAEKMNTEITETEVSDAILMLRKMKYQADIAKSATNPTEAPAIETITTEMLPEFTDEIASSFGAEFKTVAELTEKLKQNLIHEKQHRAEEALRARLVDRLIADTTIEIPDILINHEVERMIAELTHDVALSDLSFNEYLQRIGKSGDDVRADLRPRAESRVKIQMILEKIAEEESITPNQTKISEELERLAKQYENNPEFNRERALAYLTEVYTNQAVFTWLETIGGHTPHTC